MVVRRERSGENPWGPPAWCPERRAGGAASAHVAQRLQPLHGFRIHGLSGRAGERPSANSSNIASSRPRSRWATCGSLPARFVRLARILAQVVQFRPRRQDVFPGAFHDAVQRAAPEGGGLQRLGINRWPAASPAAGLAFQGRTEVHPLHPRGIFKPSRSSTVGTISTRLTFPSTCDALAPTAPGPADHQRHVQRALINEVAVRDLAMFAQPFAVVRP